MENLTVSVVAALASGSSFAVGSVLQQSAASMTPKDEQLSWRLLVDLAHRRTWLLGIASDVLSFSLQALALAFGPLALVQPILVCGLLFAVPLSVRRRKRRLGRREWAATISVAAGLALFLVVASPTAGTPQTSGARWTLVLIAIAGLMAVATAAGRVAHGPLRPSLYAIAAGTSFGLLAALTKTSTWLLSHGAGTFFTAWQPYAMAAVAVIGAIIQQSAYQSGPLATSVPIMDAAEPTVAVLIGVFAFSETVSSSPLALAAELLAVVVLLAGIVSLDRSPVVEELQAAPPSRDRRSSGYDGKRSATTSSGNSS